MTFNQNTATNVNVQSTGSESITFDGDINGKMVGKTHDGKISLDTPNINYSIQLESYNGAISIKTDKEPKNVTYDIKGGNINIFEKYKKSTVIGNGDNLIKLKAHSGKISVMK
jgi:hypothetical protein